MYICTITVASLDIYKAIEGLMRVIFMLYCVNFCTFCILDPLIQLLLICKRNNVENPLWLNLFSNLKKKKKSETLKRLGGGEVFFLLKGGEVVGKKKMFKILYTFQISQVDFVFSFIFFLLFFFPSPWFLNSLNFISYLFIYYFYNKLTCGLIRFHIAYPWFEKCHFAHWDLLYLSFVTHLITFAIKNTKKKKKQDQKVVFIRSFEAKSEELQWDRKYSKYSLKKNNQTSIFLFNFFTITKTTKFLEPNHNQTKTKW